MLSFRKAFSLLELSVVILIIGILVASLAQATRFYKDMKFTGARALTKSSEVSSIPDLVLWLETTSDKSFSTDRPEQDTIISQWNDINPQIMEGRKINAINPNSGRQPIYKMDVLNSLPALRFDGVDDYLTVADGFDGDTENVTMFFVWQVNTNNGALGMVLLEKWEGSGPYPYVLRSSSPGVYYMHSYDGSVGRGPGSSTIRKFATPTIIAARRIKNGIMNFWMNGSKEGGDVMDTASSASTANNARLCICSRITSSYCNGDVGEIIIFARAISDDEKKAVEKYLGKKWGIRVI